MKKFSLITPIYKKSYKYFPFFYECLKNQDYDNWEVIVVLDGHNQKARKFFKKYKGKIKLYEIPHGGAPAARNYGVSKMTGDYILLADPDVYLYEGTLTEWAEALEDYPEIGYVYGHYDIRGGGKIPAREWDAYDLGCSNYISGMAPIRKELWIPQDESMKSLQDWDMWLTLWEKKKVKGKFINKTFFATEPPGKISAHSHKNWIAQTDKIRNKHNNPKSDLVITSTGAYHHALHAAKKLKADILPNPAYKPHKYKVIYLMGFYPEDSQFNIKVLETAKKKIIHFIGSDIYKFRNNMSWEALDSIKKYFKKQKVILLSETKHTHDELAEMGIETEIVPIPPKKLYKPIPLPKKFVIANYVNPTQDMYHEQLVAEIARSMPDVDFKFFGNQGGHFVKNDIEYMGWVDMKKFIPQCSALIRLTVHDGLPLAPMEFITAGRNVLTSTKLKYMEHTKIDKDEIVKKIRAMIKMGINEKGSSYWRKKLNFKKYKNAINKCCNACL